MASEQEVWIIGASRGLGRELARHWRGRGWRVVGMARRPAEDAAEDETFQAIDMVDPASVEAAIGGLYAAGRRPDLIVACAALAVQGSFLDLANEAAREEAETNYLGFVRLAQSVARAKPAGQKVRLVAVGTTLAYVGCPSLETYGASKAALVAFARAIRPQLKPLGIDVTILSPPHMENAAGNGVDLIGPQPFGLAWSARRLAAAAESGRREHLLGATNRLLLLIARLSPALAQAIMNPIGLAALERRRRFAGAA